MNHDNNEPSNELQNQLQSHYINLLIEGDLDKIQGYFCHHQNAIEQYIDMEEVLIFYIYDGQYKKDVIDFLEQQGADLSIGHFHFIKTALEKNNIDIASHLLDKGYPKNFIGLSWTHLLMEKAIMHQHIEAFEFLLKHQADIHYHDDFLLRKAVRLNHYPFVKLLIEYGANASVFTIDFQKNNPRVNDWLEGGLEVSQLLVQHGADIHLHHNSSLNRAMIKGDYPLLEYFIDQGCDTSTIIASNNETAKAWLRAKQLKDKIHQDINEREKNKNNDLIKNELTKNKI